MKTFKRGLIVVVCAWLLWSLFAAVFLAHCSGSSGSRGYSVADLDGLHAFLETNGFKLESEAPNSEKTSPQQRFRGRFRGSRPFHVTISTITTNVFGVYVKAEYDFRGLRWSVHNSCKKAQEFADTLFGRLGEHRAGQLEADLTLR